MRMSWVAVAGALVGLAACSGDGGGAGASTTALFVEPATSSSLPGATTVPAPEPTTNGQVVTPTLPATPVPTEPPTTAFVLNAATFLLRSDGIGPLRFGASMAETIAVTTGVVGPATVDGPTVHYTTNRDFEVLVNLEAVTSFEYAYGRENCFADGLCVMFGGESEASLAFVGWTCAGEHRDLHATDGSQPGTRGAQTDTLVIGDLRCSWEAHGTVSGGIRVGVHSNGRPFTEVDTTGIAVDRMPEAGDIVIIEMAAGILPAFLYNDC
ncbi:MAG: hypothetical protein AB7N61_12875 [Acidimicrobiia bacterium]